MPFISVRITRDGVTKEQKAQVIAEITKTMETVLNKDPHLTHIVIEEVDTDSWGYAGITTTEYRKQLTESKVTLPVSIYPSNRTAYLLVDPYNDFLSEDGKIFPLIKPIAEQVGLLDNLRTLDRAVRAHNIPVVIVPHHRWEHGDYEGWDHPTQTQCKIMHMHHFARGEWGGEWHPDFAPQDGDIVVQEHWGSSGFANTDLDFRLKQKGITHVIIVGLLANTCIEATARYASELGYHVTLVSDATAAFRAEMMHAAHELNGPTFAHSIVTTDELIAALALQE